MIPCWRKKRRAKISGGERRGPMRLIPSKLGTPHGEAGQEEKFFTLATKNFEHPIASVWNDPAAGTPTAAHFFRAFSLSDSEASQVTPILPGAAPRLPVQPPQVVLRFADGSPAVMERPVGLGRVILFSSSADTSWNDLPVRPGIFVPLMYRAIGSIVSRQDEAINIGVGQRFVYRPGIDTLGREVKINGPTGELETRTVELQSNTAILQDNATSFAGEYKATIAGEKPTALKFAAQADKNESRLELLDEQQLRTLGDVADVVRWTSGGSTGDRIRSGGVGTEFWKALALMVLLLAAMETFTANWFSASK